MIKLKKKESEATEEPKKLKVRLTCTRVEVDKTYKVTLGEAQTSSVPNIQAQVCVPWHHSFVRLASSVEQAPEHKSKGIGFKLHVRLNLCLEHILCVIIYDMYIYSKYISYNAPPYGTLPHTHH